MNRSEPLLEWQRARLREKITNSISVIEFASEQCASQGVPLLVNFSGGKDSATVLHLVLMVNDVKNVEGLYMTSGMELPGCVDHVLSEAKRYGILLHITDPVRDYMGDYKYWFRRFGYFPNTQNAYCSGRLKIRPQRSYLRKLFGKKSLYKLTGVRKAESGRRMKIYSGDGFISEDGEHAGSYMVNPIINWSDKDVVMFLEENNITVNKLYRNFGVSGCAWCPFYQKSIYERIVPVFPHLYDEMIMLEEELGKPSVSGRLWLKNIVRNVLSVEQPTMF